MTDEQKALFAKARRALQTARANLDEDDPEAASNRAYYAAYYAATAALYIPMIVDNEPAMDPPNLAACVSACSVS